MPADWNVAAEPGSRDLRLVAGASAIDAGTALPNLNDAFILSGPPDMGAFEYGQPLPEYGPRGVVPDLSSSAKQVSRPVAGFGETVTYTVLLRNTGAPLTATVALSDTIPAGLAYVPGSLTATLEAVDDSAAPVLRWSGLMSSTPTITLTYAVTVTGLNARSISNTVILSDGIRDILTLTATIIINGRAIYLPLLFK